METLVRKTKLDDDSMIPAVAGRCASTPVVSVLQLWTQQYYWQRKMVCAQDRTVCRVRFHQVHL